MDNMLLLQEVRTMNAEAITKVFDLYSSAIFNYAFRYYKRAIIADQIVGDVFAKLIEQLSLGCGPHSNIRSYLFEIAYNLMVDEIRYSRRRTSIEKIEYAVPANRLTDTSAEQKMLLENIWQAMQNELTEDQRNVIILRLIEGFSLKETALIMGKTITSIKVTQHRAIAVLRQALDDQELDYKAELRAVAL